MNFKDRKFAQSIYLTHPFLLSSGPFTTVRTGGARRGRRGAAEGYL
jgi:hypothetical protein